VRACVSYKMPRVADESSSADEMETVQFEQPNPTSTSDITEHKQVITARSSGVVGRILELKKRRQQQIGKFVISSLILCSSKIFSQ